MNSSVRPRQLLERVMQRTLDYDFTVWQWGDAVTVDGLLEAGEILKRKAPLNHLHKFYSNWAKRPRAWIDHLTPGLGLLRIQEKTGDARLLNAAKELAAQLKAAPRARYYDVPMYRPDLDRQRHSVWVDTIYHEPSFLCRLAQATSDDKYYDDALDVWFSHVRALESGHGPFLAHSRDACSCALKGYGWGRGQGWAFYGMIDTLEMLPKKHPGYAKALTYVKNYAEILRRQQDRSGFWRTLIHDREAYLETSSAAFLGGAFLRGVRIGVLGREYAKSADLAWDAVISRVDDKGAVFGVSAWTLAGVTMEDQVSMYKTLPTEMNCWGQGCVLRFCAERIYSYGK
jgi:unsaturated rhamnogalacturonyl hydrolase